MTVTRRRSVSMLTAPAVAVLCLASLCELTSAASYYGHSKASFRGSKASSRGSFLKTSSKSRSNDIERRLRSLENLVESLTVTECDAGSERLTICDLGIFECAFFGNTTDFNATIQFNKVFQDVPVVKVSLSGLALYVIKDCFVEVTEVSTSSVSITIVLGSTDTSYDSYYDDYNSGLPLDVQVSYFACATTPVVTKKAGLTRFH